MTAKGYDFLTWIGKTSGPSCAKLVNDTDDWFTWWVVPVERALAVTPSARLRGEVMVKQKGCPGPWKSHLAVRAADLPEYPWIVNLGIPNGTFDWTKFTFEADVPPNVSSIIIYFASSPNGVNWFDDLKIYQDGVLIYSDDFSKWDPVIGAGVGAGILGVVVPAVVRVPEPGVAYEYQKPVLEKDPLLAAGLAGLGALVGGGVGLLTAMGLVPVPQIPPLPTLEEAPLEKAHVETYVVRG